MSDVATVTTETFAAEVIEASRLIPVLVDFWAPWCAPCRALGPILEAIAREFDGRLRVVKVDSDEEPDLSQRFAVQSIPAVKLFRDGVVVAEFLGAQPAASIRAFLDPHLPRPSIAAQAAALDLARLQADRGETAAATATLDALPPAAQSDAATRSARAHVHFAAIAGGLVDAPAAAAASRAGAARKLLTGDADGALEDWFTALRASGARAERAALCADLLRAFEFLQDSHPSVGAARRRLAALLH